MISGSFSHLFTVFLHLRKTAEEDFDRPPILKAGSAECSVHTVIELFYYICRGKKRELSNPDLDTH